jgi:peptide/nickel transport system substrate-binding protein
VSLLAGRARQRAHSSWSQRRACRRVAAFVGLVAAVTAIAGCGGGSGSTASSGSPAGTGASDTGAGGSGGSGGGATFTMQFAGPPISLNPALAGNGGSSVFTSLDYDPLIYLTGSGHYVPDLATSWHYVGQGHKAFQLTLRKGVTFTDGTAMTAKSVVASMKYFLTAGGGLLGGVGQIASITAPNSHTVLVRYKTPNPDAVSTMDQYAGIGSIIGPKGLANPKSLLTSSDGTGQYAYDNGASVANSVYTYTRNPHYFNPSAQQFAKVQVKVIGEPSAVLSALQTGQVDFAGGSPTTLDAAKAAGIAVLKEPFFNWTLILPSAKNPVAALENPKVRQAIAYALNRPSIAHAIGSSSTLPSGQVMVPGANGYVSGAGYTYDLAKAKQLMASAGYPHGFTLPVVTESLIDVNTTISQAIVAGLSAIGIKANLTVVSTGIGQFSAAAQSGKYGAVIFPSAGADMYLLANQVLPPGIFNPMHLTPPAGLTSLLASAYAKSGAAQTALYEKANRQLTAMATLVPVVVSEPLNFVSSKLENVHESFLNPNPVPEAPTAALAWRLK